MISSSNSSRKPRRSPRNASITSSTTDKDNGSNHQRKTPIRVEPSNGNCWYCCLRTHAFGLLFLMILLNVSCDYGSESDLRQETEDEPQPMLRNRQHGDKPRQLTFDDLRIGKLLGQGSVNFVFRVNLPPWWHRQQQEQQHNENSATINAGIYPYNPDRKYVVKIADSEWLRIAQREQDALQTLNSQNPTAARALKITPLIWSNSSIVNPYYDDKKNSNKNTRLPRPLPKGAEDADWQKYSTLSAIVVPNEVTEGQNYNVYNSEVLGSSPHKTIHFMQTLLATLQYAHSLQINVNDVSPRNVHCDQHGNAIVSDWNNLMKQGEAVYDSEMEHGIVPPEFHFANFPVIQRQQDHNHPSTTRMQEPLRMLRPVLQTSIHAFDIWSAGIMFANLLWDGDECELLQYVKTDRGRTEDSKWYFQQLMSRGLLPWSSSSGLNMSGANIILNSHGDQANLAEFVGIDAVLLRRTNSLHTWSMPVCEGRSYNRKDLASCRPCQRLEQWGPILKQLPRWQQQAAVDLIRRMLTVSLQDRPTAAELLRHDLFQQESGPVNGLYEHVSSTS
mmetsp:Transcript_16331/g.38599  ORF Transcript_16331/g.38599 Transcript_16331/m.38599 type:complete len:560 (-) Transcript_16331:15-1694(-)